MNTVLVVEDGITDRERINQYLKQAGLSAINVGSSEEALVKLHHHRPDLIVLDVILPGQSGFELCRELKTNPQTSQIPVVICSTKNTDVDKMWGDMLGANAYIPKPVDRSEFLQTVQRLMKV